MVTAGGGGSEEVEFRAKFNIDVAALQAQLKQVFGNIPNMIGQASGQFGGGQGNVNESGTVKQNTKEQDERSRVRTASLKHLAQQFPGGGLMTGMAQAFKGGGLMAGVATGITAAVGILTSIMKSSQVFQTLSGTVFKVLGFMADMFLMPFVPMMMKFVNWMLQHMPQIQAAGEKTVSILEGIGRILNFGSNLTKEGKEEGGFGGAMKRIGGALTSKEAMLFAAGAGLSLTGVGAGVGGAMMVAGGARMAHKASTGQYQMGGVVPGGPGEGVPAMLHGGEMVIPQDIAAGAKGMGGRVAAWIERFQQKEMGPGGVINKWYDEMFGNSIMPKMWGDIRGLFQNIEDETGAVGRSVETSTGDINKDQSSFWSKLKFWEKISEGWGAIKDCLNLVKDKIFGFFDWNISLPSLPNIDWSGLMGKLGEVSGKITGWIAEAVDFAIPDVPKPNFSWGAIWSCMSTIGSSIAGFFTNTVPNALENAAKGILGGLISAGKFLANLPGKIITCLWDVAKTVGGFFWNTIPDKIMDTVRNIAGWSPNWGSVWTSITSKLGELVGKVKDKAIEIAKGIGGGVWSFLTGNQFGRLSGNYRPPRRAGLGGPSGDFVPGGDTGQDTGKPGGDGDSDDDPGGDDGGRGDGQVINIGGNQVSTKGESRGQNAGGLGPAVFEVDMGSLSSRAGGDRAGEAGYGGSGGRSWGAQAPAVYYEDTSTIEGALTTNLGTIGRSGTYYVAPTRMIASGLHARGRTFGRLNGGGGGGGGTAIANRVVNISISSNQSVADIVKDVERLQTMDEASFFNSVF